jgi:hypothetical protein
MSRKNLNSLIITAAFSATSFYSCGRAKSPVAPLNPNPGFGLVQEATDANLSGYWVSPCGRPSSGIFGWDYVRRQVQFKDKALTVIVAAYKTVDCNPADAERMLILSGNYQLGGRASGDGSTLDYSINVANFGAISAHGASLSNMGAGVCGIKNFVVGDFRDVKDVKPCDYLYTAGIKPFTIVGLDKERLAFGNYYSSDDIGTTAASRPSNFAFSDELDKTTTPIFEL